MSDSFFKFEREGIDFPFYNNNPKLNQLDWILLLISVLGINSLYFITNNLIFWICVPLPMIIILVISRFKLSLIFKKLTKKDIALMVVLTILSIYISTILYDLLSLCINLPPDESSLPVPFGLSIPYLLQTIELAICLINEELFKFGIFILVLALVYKLSNNRKMGVVCAAFVTMVIFGAWHFDGYGGLMKLISDIIGRGLGSICEVYSYVKTKNILIPYFIHLFFDISCDLPFL